MAVRKFQLCFWRLRLQRKLIRRWQNWIEDINELKDRQNRKMKRRESRPCAKVVMRVNEAWVLENEKIGKLRK